ncbi:MAG: DNA-processing protein DprA [Clostridia bacterium]|nr:DNA-processing protein DprA [Clostridia bacterium]
MIYWVWLQCALGAGNNRYHRIISKFSTAKALYEASSIKRIDAKIFSKREIERMIATPLSKAEEVLKLCEREGIRVITPNSPCYPNCLKNIAIPPYALYVKGDFPNFNETPAICIVGTRAVSEYGYKCAYSLSGRLSMGGFIIVSGGAIGSDTAAHLGAMLTGGKTVALLAHGFGVSYLNKNEKLREDIVRSGGCLITEFPPNTPVTKQAFHVRNRLMSALTVGTVVVEAPFGSGSLITAANATEQGKDVFVIPGQPGLENYEGSNELLRDGAKPVLQLEDIFSEYTYRLGDKISIDRAMAKPLPSYRLYVENTEKSLKKEKKPPYKLKEATDVNWVKKENNEIIKKILPENLSKNAKMLYNQLDKQIFTCDDLLSPAFDSKAIISALGELELFGFIKSLPGGRYSLK